jgi:hypothetical protein
MNKDHNFIRQTPLGRWLPVVFYLVNFCLWILIDILSGALNLLFLAILPIPAIVIYIVRTQRNEL